MNPHVVPTVYTFLSSASNTKQDILKNVDNQMILTSYFFLSYYRSQWGPSTVWLPILLKISFVLSRRKKFILVWNILRMTKCWKNYFTILIHFFPSLVTFKFLMQSFQDLIIKRLLAKVDLKGHFVTAPNNVKKKKKNE